MATVRSAGHQPGVWKALIMKAFPGNKSIKNGKPKIIISDGAPDCASPVGTLCWYTKGKGTSMINGDAYICTVASGTWVKINA